eukprot:2419843-Pleurochrysis_carterae.AAC.4
MVPTPTNPILAAMAAAPPAFAAGLQPRPSLAWRRHDGQWWQAASARLPAGAALTRVACCWLAAECHIDHESARNWRCQYAVAPILAPIDLQLLRRAMRHFLADCLQLVLGRARDI